MHWLILRQMEFHEFGAFGIIPPPIHFLIASFFQSASAEDSCCPVSVMQPHRPCLWEAVAGPRPAGRASARGRAGPGVMQHSIAGEGSRISN